MDSEPRVVFRVEPEVPNLQQAVRDVKYGTPMVEPDIAILKAVLHNILDFFIPALKESSRNGSPFLTCFKESASWPIVLVILKRCEAIIKYSLGHEGMQHVQQSLGTLRFIKGGRPRASKGSCGMIGAQAEKTIWLYEGWWKSHSLGSPKGVKPEKGHNGKAFDALAEAFMASQEGTMFHEIVHLASHGQMKRLLSSAYPCDRLPPALIHRKDMIGDAVIHEHVNIKLHSDNIIDAKYARPGKGAGIVWQGAYHLAGVRDLATLEKGKVASILNADSYNAFAALALMRRVEASFANDPFTSTDGVPHLHPDAIGRLRKAISMGKNSAQVELRKTEVIGAREMLSSQGQVRSSTDQHRQDRISDLGCWPALGEVAAAKLTKSDLKRR